MTTTQLTTALEQGDQSQPQETLETTLAQRTVELNEREKALLQREQQIKAHKALQARGLSEHFLPFLPLDNDEEMEKGINAFEKAFQEAVTQALQERLKGTTPQAMPQKATAEMSDAEYYRSIAR